MTDCHTDTSCLIGSRCDITRISEFPRAGWQMDSVIDDSRLTSPKLRPMGVADWVAFTGLVLTVVTLPTLPHHTYTSQCTWIRQDSKGQIRSNVRWIMEF